jgi:phosphoribosylformylglycinamidine synthase II
VGARRIEIAVKPGLEDPVGRHVKWSIRSYLGTLVEDVRTVSVYTVLSQLAEEELLRFGEQVLNDPVLSCFSLGSPIARRFPPFQWAIEISFKPGVTDNVGKTARDVLDMMFGKDAVQAVYRSTQYLISGALDRNEAEKIGREILHNDLIEDMRLMSRDEFEENGGFPAEVRRFPEGHAPRVELFDLHGTDEELLALSRSRTLALTLDEMKYFRDYFDLEEVRQARRAAGIGGLPTDVELEAFAQTQSEHCKHKIFNAEVRYRERSAAGGGTAGADSGEAGGKAELISSLFGTYIRGATEKVAGTRKWLVSVFQDNAGVIRFDQKHNLAFKVETHNSPSALDPYGGAITGIVGVDRDPAGTGLGSRIVAHTDVLCFGDPGYSGELPPRMMHPRRIMEGVVKGIEDGGNKCGIPTVNGGVIFDPSYSGKPLVFCGSVGIMPAELGGEPSHEKRVRPGDVVVMVGGRIGKDGIHGATFSSEEITESSPVQAVQIGDPITQKKMLDMLEEARGEGLYRAITDNGAGGLSSSVGEMAQFSGGAELELEKAPLKYQGLDPWEVLLSEAQERMTLAVPEEKLERFMDLAARRDVLAVPIGSFTDSGYFRVNYDGKPVCFLGLSFLHSRMPLRLEAEWVEPEEVERPPVPADREIGGIILEMVSDLNSCSREPIIRRYDHEVQGCVVLKPLTGGREVGPSDGGVITPVYGSARGFVLASGINPFYSRVDTFHMAACCVDEAIRNAVSVGADPDYIALLDNFCWPDPVYHPVKTPDGRYKLAQLVRAARGLYRTATAYGAPFISGKDSMKNDYKIGDHTVSVLPTILVSALGIVPDTGRCVSSDFKCRGDAIYLVGRTGDHLGQSLFYRKYGGSSAKVPVVEALLNLELYRAYFAAVQEELLSSGHDLSEGGLAVAAAESCIAGRLGARIDLGLLLESGTLPDETLLFSESAGRILVSVRPGCESAFKAVFGDLPHARIGAVTGDSMLEIRGSSGTVVARVGVEDLTDAYRRPLFGVLGMKP